MLSRPCATQNGGLYLRHDGTRALRANIEEWKAYNLDVAAGGTMCLPMPKSTFPGPSPFEDGVLMNAEQYTPLWLHL